MANELSAPLPDLTLEEKSLLVVDSGNAGAIITRIVVHFAQDIPGLTGAGGGVPPIVLPPADVLLAWDQGSPILDHGPVLP